MRRNRLSLTVAATCAALIVATNVYAQAAPWRVVQASDGSLHLIKDGARHWLVPAAISDEDLLALPEGEPLLAGDLPGAARPVAPLMFEGTGIRKTDLFYLDGGHYRVQWTAAARSGATSCSHGAWLKAVDESRRYQELVANEAAQPAAGSVTNLFNVRAGDYYFDIGSTCSWSISIQPR